MPLYLIHFRPPSGPARTVPVDASQITGNVWLMVCPFCRATRPSCQVYTDPATAYRCFNIACHYRRGTVTIEPVAGIDVLLDIRKAAWGEHVGFAKQLTTTQHTNGRH